MMKRTNIEVFVDIEKVIYAQECEWNRPQIYLRELLAELRHNLGITRKEFKEAKFSQQLTEVNPI